MTVRAQNPERQRVRALFGILAIIGLACAFGILLLQGKTCGVEQYPAELSPVIFIGLTISGVLGIVNGLVISSRQPGNRIGWLCETTGTVGLIGAFMNRYALCGLYGSFDLPAVATAAWLSYILAPLIIALVFWQIPLWFPYGRYLSFTWKLFAVAAWTVLIPSLVLVALLPGRLAGNGVSLSYQLANPAGFAGLDHLYHTRWIPRLIVSTLLFVSLAANLSLILRWRLAKTEERQQIKWFAFFGVVIVSLFLTIETISQFVYPALAGSLVYVAVFYLAWIGFPVVIGLSVLKYRLYDIDIVIRRTLAYAALSILLALIYLGSVTVLQLMLAGLSGQRSQVALVISTLVIAGLFNPLRRTLQNGIDRRFYRSKYDAARTLEAFSAAIRDEVELKQLLAYLETAVDDTLQPVTVSIWLVQAPDRALIQGKTA